MSSPKEYYWKKALPQNPIILEDGTVIRFEEMGDTDAAYKIGYAKVNEDTHKALQKMAKAIALPSGTAEGSKAEYDELKKKLLENPLQPLWREEITGNNQPRQTRQLNVAEGNSTSKDAIEVQADVEPLPENSKPKTGKRKSSDSTED